MREKKTTSIRIDPELWKQVRKYAIDNGKSVGEFVENSLTFLVKRPEFLSLLSCIVAQPSMGVAPLSTGRSDFIWDDDLVDFNSGLLGSNPKRVIAKVIAYLDDIGKYGSSSMIMSKRLENEEETCRRNLASALGSATNEIIHETNTTRSLRLAYEIIKTLTDLSPSDKILISDLEHDSVRNLLRIQSGLGIEEAPILSLFAKACGKDSIVDGFLSKIDSQTRIILISHIPFIGGKLPVHEIIKASKEAKKDIYCVIDGAHALGQMRIDVKEMDCDFYGVGVHKFCLGLAALGSLYSKREYLAKACHNGSGLPIFDSYAVPKMFRKDEELGTINAIPIIAFNEAFDLLYKGYGIQNIQNRIESLAQYFLKRAAECGKTVRIVSPTASGLVSGVISLSLRDFSYRQYRELVQWLETEHRILCKALRKPPCMRVCLHYFHTQNDIDRFFGVLGQKISKS